MSMDSPFRLILVVNWWFFVKLIIKAFVFFSFISIFCIFFILLSFCVFFGVIIAQTASVPKGMVMSNWVMFWYWYFLWLIINAGLPLWPFLWWGLETTVWPGRLIFFSRVWLGLSQDSLIKMQSISSTSMRVWKSTTLLYILCGFMFITNGRFSAFVTLLFFFLLSYDWDFLNLFCWSIGCEVLNRHIYLVYLLLLLLHHLYHLVQHWVSWHNKKFKQFVQFHGQPVFPSYCKYLQWDLHIKVDGKMCRIFTRI